MSTTAGPRTRHTPDDLLTMPDGEGYELVDGHLVERNVGALSSHVAARLVGRVGRFCEDRGLGWAFDSECGYRCFADDPDRVRRPDLSFIRSERLPEGPPSEGYLGVAPDLAVEVVSPRDLAYEVDRKVDEYLGAGVRLIWVVNPEQQAVRVHRADGSVGLLRGPDELGGEDVLPGFACRVAELFPNPPGAAPAP